MEYVDMLRSSSFVNETDVLIQDSWGRLAAMNDDWTNEYMFVHTWTGVIYYALNIPLLIFNFFPAINPLERWKIQKGKYETFPNVCKMMVYVVVNQTLSTAAAVMTQPRRDISIETVPSCVDLAWQVVACMVLYDSFFFCLHCIMHTEWMYYNIHQTHHLSKTSIGISNAYFNPIDYVLTTFCVYIPPLLISNHVVTQIVWFSVLVCESTNAHCGYRIPFLPDARDHDFHHSHSNHANEKYRFVNMGSFFLIWDRILGTRDPCTNWWIEKEAAEKEAQKKTQ